MLDELISASCLPLYDMLFGSIKVNRSRPVRSSNSCNTPMCKWYVINVKKTYQFKTHCMGDSHSSKTDNIILPGFMIKQVNALTSTSEMVFKFNCMLVETRTRIIYFQKNHKMYARCTFHHIAGKPLSGRIL